MAIVTWELDIFTGTGTGTVEADLSIPELTDMQVGSNCVMDAEYLRVEGSGNGRPKFAPALTLHATVVSANRKEFVTVDAGLKQLYYACGVPPLVAGRGRREWKYEWFGDEHGKITMPRSDRKKLSIGKTVELVLPHCDPTINLHDRIWALSGSSVTDCWEIDLRGLGE